MNGFVMEFTAISTEILACIRGALDEDIGGG